MSTIVAGVDPGKDGAFAVIRDGKVVFAETMPLCRDKSYDIESISKIIRVVDGKWSPVWMVEKLTALPPAMGGSFANFGRGWCMGMLESLLLSSGPNFVPPRTWQSKLFGKIPKGSTKKASSDFASSIVASVPLRMRKDGDIHYGVSDAICIAFYGTLLLDNQ